MEVQGSEVAQQILSAGVPTTVETFGQETKPVQQESAQTSKTDNVDKPEQKQESKFDIIAKMERKLRKEREEIEARKKEIELSSQKYKQLEELDSTWEKNPLEFMEKKGWDFEKLNKFVMENGDPRHVDPMAKKLFEYENKFKELETKTEQKIRDAIEAKEKELMQKEQNMQLEMFKGEVKSFINQNKDKYEFVASEGDSGLGLVFDLIQTDVMNQLKSGKKENELKIMTMDDACEKVEKYLDSTLEKYLSLNKVKSKFGQKQEKLPEQVREKVTISDTFAARTNSQPMSEQDRVKQAIELVTRGVISN